MSPRWWRFFEELYRRTGAIEDNINNADRVLTGAGTTGTLALAGVAPTAEISVTEAVPVGALALASEAPTVIVPTVPGGSLSLAGVAPTIV
jgi:hypothetical protein